MRLDSGREQSSECWTIKGSGGGERWTVELVCEWTLVIKNLEKLHVGLIDLGVFSLVSNEEHRCSFVKVEDYVLCVWFK